MGISQEREKMTNPINSKMTDMDVQCATEHCKDAPETGQPHCAECAMVTIWAADAAKKRELGIYPSRATGNHSVERIAAIEDANRKRAQKARARELCSEEQLETVLAHQQK